MGRFDIALYVTRNLLKGAAIVASLYIFCILLIGMITGAIP